MTESIKGHYEAALRHHKGDLDLQVELGSFLFMNGKYSEARAVFSKARGDCSGRTIVEGTSSTWA
jgi:Tfp pilus assembly protein PilF